MIDKTSNKNFDLEERTAKFGKSADFLFKN